jgi:PAS domain S-box-containing protein
MNNLPAEKNRRILIIDDNHAIHDDFRKILSPATIAAAALDVAEAELFGKPASAVRQIRYEIDSAYQGQGGVLLVKQALAAGRPYAVAFVDVRMPPGMDGVETTRKIWELDPDLQVVLCTAYSDYSWGEMFEKLGQHDGLLILKKPFDTVEALQLAHALTEKWWLHQQSRQKMEDLEGMIAARTGELQWKTAFLEAQVNSSIDGILVVDQKEIKTLQNQRFVDLLKIPPHIADDKDDEKQRRWVASITKNPEPFIERIIYLNSHPDEISRDEMELKDGTILDRYSAPVVGRDGKYYGRIWTFRDITGRKQAEAALMRLAAIIESSDDAIIGKDLNSIITSWNKGAEKLFGYTSDEMVGTSIMRLIPADRQDEEDQILGKIRHGESVEQFETLRQTKGGRLVDVSVTASPIRDATGKVIGVSKVARDITERKRTELALRDSEAFLNTVVENIPHMIFVKDARELRFVKFNKAGQELLGYSLAELAGKNDYDFFPKDLADYFTENDRKVLLGKKAVDIPEESVQTRDKGERILHTKKIPVFDNAGQLVYLLGISEDITGRKQLEERLFQSQKLETVGKLAGGIAHEFNSILTAIIGQSDLLLGDLPAGSPLARNATEISKAANRAAALTRQLLAYGRKQFLRPEALDLNRVVTGMEGVFQHLLGAGVDTQIVPASGLHLVKADAGQIEQVIMNLAMNARDAMPNGGKLTLETANVLFDQDSVGRYPELKPGNYVMLAITDTGTGMSEAVKARVFDPFFSTKGIGQGTGLGLSTCYGIVKQSGGHISVYSEPGRGTTFKIYLPQVEPPAEIPIERLDSPDLPRGAETILLVEDDPALREMAAMLLRRLGYAVLTAGHGIEALSLCHQRDTGRIDLLFTDVVMPHMSGKELADRVRALYPQTKILFTSAYTENAIVHQGVLDPGMALLQKPFTPSALARKVREVLDPAKPTGS